MNNRIHNIKRGSAVWSLVVILLLFISPNLKAQTRSSVDVKTLAVDLKKAAKDDFRSYDRTKYLIRKIKVREDDSQRKKFDEIAVYKKRKLTGPFISSDSSVYFIQKIKTGYDYKFSFYELNVIQPFGMSDANFQEALTDLNKQCRRSNKLLPEFIDSYKPKKEIRYGKVMSPGWFHEHQVIPEVRKFMVRKPIGAFFQSSKTTIEEVTFLTLLQKAAKKKKVKTITYLKIIIKD
jgi:hypothetical protein